MHGSTGGGWHGATYATGQSSTLPSINEAAQTIRSVRWLDRKTVYVAAGPGPANQAL
jgi:hypothetical protein